MYRVIATRERAQPAVRRITVRVRLAGLDVATAILALAVAAILLIVTGSAQAGDTQVYKTVDAQGHVIYTDKPSAPNTAKTSVSYHEPSAEDLARVEQQRQASQTAELQRVQQAVANSASEAQQAQQRKNKEIRCQNARNYYYSLKDATRLYQRDEQGNRIYLPDEAADAKRTAARKAMDAACGP